MNEQIRELAHQAEILITDAGAFHNTSTGAYQLKGEHLAKFAELIVRECASLFDSTKEMKTIGMLTHNQVVEQIKKHFGVEK